MPCFLRLGTIPRRKHIYNRNTFITENSANAGELADKAREAVKNADVEGLARKAKDILPDQADSVIDSITEKLK